MLRAIATTTIRISTDTHARLVELSRAQGATLGETVEQAAEALRRQLFARAVTAELAELRRDREAWEDYLADAEATHVGDGIA